jgi:hypothetical protein
VRDVEALPERLAEARDLASALASASDDRAARAVLLAESAEWAFREFARHQLSLRIPPEQAG